MNDLISVSMLAYNHGAYLAAALDSVLAQKVDRPFEIVLGVDASDDDTAAVARRYRDNHPDAILLIEHAARVGGPTNFLGVIRKCRGQYIAHLDGDDLMLPGKLEKQAVFLDQNPGVAFVGHNLQVLRSGAVPSELFTHDMPPLSDLDDLVRLGTRMGHSSIMYRASSLDLDSYQRLHKESHGDWFLQILAARYGRIGYLDEVLGAYRIHSASVSRRGQTPAGKREIFDTQRAILLRSMDLGVPKGVVDEGLARLSLVAANEMFQLGAYGEYRTLIEESWRHYPRYGHFQVRAYQFRRFPPIFHVLLAYWRWREALRVGRHRRVSQNR